MTRAFSLGGGSSFLFGAVLVIAGWGCDGHGHTGAGGSAGTGLGGTSTGGAGGGVQNTGGVGGPGGAGQNAGGAAGPGGAGQNAGGAAGVGTGGQNTGGTGGPGGGGRSGGGGAGGGPDCAVPTPAVDSTMAGCPPVAFAPLGAESHPNEGQTHLVLCSTACYGTNPPSSGNHYPSWPIYKTYTAPVPWGFLVHGLEHGAIVVSYNCPCGCADEVAAAQNWINALPKDEACNGPPRVVMAPDPALDVRWAASAWTWTLRAQSFDAAAFQAFFTAHYGQCCEAICEGSTDGSAVGWCQ